jgi:hypothetical protein
MSKLRAAREFQHHKQNSVSYHAVFTGVNATAKHDEI